MKIKISEIENKDNKTDTIRFSEIIEEFNEQEPVEGEFKAEIQSTLVKITGKIKAKLKLKCDYCLEEFTKETEIITEEYFEKESLNEEYNKEFEIKDNNFVQDLNGNDEIDLTDFVYQIITLNIPNRIVCGINCKGRENLEKYINQDPIDERLKVFKTIKTKDKE